MVIKMPYSVYYGDTQRVKGNMAIHKKQSLPWKFQNDNGIQGIGKRKFVAMEIYKEQLLQLIYS